MAKIRTRRRSLNKAALETVDGCDELVHPGGELPELAAAQERPAIAGRVVAHGFAQAPPHVELPAAEGAQRAADALARDVAEDVRELLFEIPAQAFRQVAQLVGELAAAGDPLHGEDRVERGVAGLDAAALANSKAQGRKQRRSQLDAAPGEAREALARPAFPLEELVQQKAKGHRGDGLCRGRGLAQCICWMPASSQPLEPSAGLTRFHTSSNSTGSVPGASRTMPEKRTLAQCSSCSVASSSRSAFNATTSVCWLG